MKPIVFEVLCCLELGTLLALIAGIVLSSRRRYF
jgi:hypothetical protein